MSPTLPMPVQRGSHAWRVRRDSSNRALLPPGDYVSPGLPVVRLDACFPGLCVGDPAQQTWPFLRREIAHNWYVDRQHPSIGWLSRDEAHLLYHNARVFQGRPALEIGCFLGWSTCHLALAGVELHVVDPLLARPEILGKVRASLEGVGAAQPVHLVAGPSPQRVRDLALGSARRWSFMFIDGDHEGDAPVSDATVCDRFAAEDAMILLHDLAAPAVARALDYLRDRGWQTMVYQTMQIMGVAWRGNVQPVAHRPDPKVAWSVPEHLRQYRVSGGEDQDGAGTSSRDLVDRILAALRQVPPSDGIPGLSANAQLDELAQWHRQGEQAWREGRFDAALATFARIAVAYPRSAVAHRYLAASPGSGTT